MSELDETRRRTGAVTETAPTPPEPPSPPAAIDGRSYTGRPQTENAETAHGDRQEPETAASSGSPAKEDIAVVAVQSEQDGVHVDTDGDSVDEATGTISISDIDDGRDVLAIAPEGHDQRGVNASEPEVFTASEHPSQPDDAKAEVPRFNRREMQPTGRTDPLYNEELYIGPDGKEHFDGDPLDTSRNSQGRLINPDGRYAPEPNPRPTEDLEERAQQDLPTRRHHEPKPNHTNADKAVNDAKTERESIEQARDASWEKIKPIADKLSTQGITMEKSNTRNNNQRLLDDAAQHLSAAERLKLGAELPKLSKLNRELKGASERLGTTGGALAIQREFPNAVLVSGGDNQKGTPGNLDRVVMIDERNKAVIVVEEKGVGSGLGSRIVPDTANPGGKHIRAEQGSTSYLRHLLQTDHKLAAALDRNPVMRERMQTIINASGQIRYLAARTAKDGKVSVTDFKIDFLRLRRATIILPTRRKGA